MRWRIEEYYRFKKTQFKFENMLVRSLKSIINLDLMLTMVLGYIGLLSEKSDERITVMQLIEVSKRIYKPAKFIFYAIADGIFAVLSKGKTDIADMLKKKAKSLQLSLFDNAEFGWA